MMGVQGYKTKKDLKEHVGHALNYVETSYLRPEYKSSGTFQVVGPDAYRNRKWYATVTMKNDKIVSVE